MMETAIHKLRSVNPQHYQESQRTLN